MHRNEAGSDAAVLVSGGADSAILTVELLEQYVRVFPIYVRFGLRWEEAERRRLIAFLQSVSATRSGLMPLTTLDEPIQQVYGDHWSNENQPGVPGAETEDAAVYLPGRNVLLAAKAAVWCRLRGVGTLAFGTLAANPFPDSTPEFFRDLELVLNRALDGDLRVVRPYAGLTKNEVLRRGRGLPLELTFSCLNPSVAGDHCGCCNKCEERRKGFRVAGIIDRTRYRAQASLTN